MLKLTISQPACRKAVQRYADLLVAAGWPITVTPGQEDRNTWVVQWQIDGPIDDDLWADDQAVRTDDTASQSDQGSTRIAEHYYRNLRLLVNHPDFAAKWISSQPAKGSARRRLRRKG